jgi:two-component system, OmpR family, sensor histidine kinase KdpD
MRYGGSDGPIEIFAFGGDQSTKIEVVDHGPGVSRAQRERLFEPFQRLDDRSEAGVGLGLSVARGFIEAMGGAMAADQTSGGGLTMRMRLPLAPKPPDRTRGREPQA